MSFQQVGVNTHVYVTGDFDGVGGADTVAMAFANQAPGAITAADFFFV